MAMIKTNWEKANSDDEKDDYSRIIPISIDYATGKSKLAE